MRGVLSTVAPAIMVLPMLIACGEVEIPFVSPVALEIPELAQADADGIIHHTEASEMKSLDDLRAEVPAQISDIRDFTLTGMALRDPEVMVYREGTDGEGELVQETLLLADLVQEVRVFISTDQERSDDDVLLAVLSDFDTDNDLHEALVTEAAQMSRYEDGGFALITEADFLEMPPAAMTIEMTLRGLALVDAVGSDE
ncbi:MAG: hypothetical protein ACI9VR_001045 [Cognaticolwellia sp.]|jgi:hypothetical protein